MSYSRELRNPIMARWTVTVFLSLPAYTGNPVYGVQAVQRLSARGLQQQQVQMVFRDIRGDGGAMTLVLFFALFVLQYDRDKNN